MHGGPIKDVDFARTRSPSVHRLWRICVDLMMMLIALGLRVGLVVPNILLRPTRAAVGARALMAAGLSASQRSHRYDCASLRDQPTKQPA
jgi:hypothetical protein